MTTIIAGSAAAFTVTVQANGAPVPVTGPVTARVFSMDGRTELVSAQTLADDATGANWPAGVVAVSLDADATGALQPGGAMLVLQGGFGTKRFRLVVETLFAPTRTSLFIRDIVIDELRADRLVAAASGALPGVTVSDDYLWSKLLAAESQIAHTLRVPLVPTRFFPLEPTQAQIDALDGMAWGIDPPYDWEPENFLDSKWGYMILRNKPVIDMLGIRIAYPSVVNTVLNMPVDWVRMDKKYAHINLVPSSPMALQTFGATLMPVLSGGRRLPFSVHIDYTAGLQNVERDWPEIIDLIKKLAVLKVLQDSFLPQSGSISADGLSESISTDMSKYDEMIDVAINGVDGNGGLIARLHGIRVAVL